MFLHSLSIHARTASEKPILNPQSYPPPIFYLNFRRFGMLHLGYFSCKTQKGVRNR